MDVRSAGGAVASLDVATACRDCVAHRAHDRAAGGLGGVRLVRQPVAARTARIAGEFVLWWLALSAGGSVVLLVVDRVARRLLPLAALLRLSLVFPDAAPSRFRAALQAGKVRRLEDRLRLMEEARERGHSPRVGRAPADAGGRAQRARQDHARALGARARLRGDGRRGDAPGQARARPAQLGRAAPRRGQAGRERRDPAQEGAPERRRVGADQAAPRVRRAARRADARVARWLEPRPSATTTSAGTGRAIRAA